MYEKVLMAATMVVAHSSQTIMIYELILRDLVHRLYVCLNAIENE